MRNFVRSIGLFRPLADQGDAWAQIMLGIMYVSGQGVPKDAAQAAKWFRLAADQGDAMAQTSLGTMYASGHGVPQDYAQAAKWFRLAADQANPSAQFMLGIMYQAGDGVPQDYVEAHKWFNLSAAWAPDADIRERAVKARDELASMMTPAQVAEAQRMSREWQPK